MQQKLIMKNIKVITNVFPQFRFGNNQLQFVKEFKYQGHFIKETYCICLYGTVLWCNYNVGSLRKLSSCYNKCVGY